MNVKLFEQKNNSPEIIDLTVSISQIKSKENLRINIRIKHFFRKPLSYFHCLVVALDTSYDLE